MRLLKKASRFARMPLGKKLLLTEAFLFLGWSRVLKLLPFSRVAPALGMPSEETSWSHTEEDVRKIRRVAGAIRTMSQYTWWESQCLVRAVAAMKMLHRRGVDSTLYLGTAKDETGRLIAHAWLRSGPFYVTGWEVMERFTVVGRFGHFAAEREGRLENV